jgi:hypothetical protein
MPWRVEGRGVSRYAEAGGVLAGAAGVGFLPAGRMWREGRAPGRGAPRKGEGHPWGALPGLSAGGGAGLGARWPARAWSVARGAASGEGSVGRGARAERMRACGVGLRDAGCRGAWVSRQKKKRKVSG